MASRRGLRRVPDDFDAIAGDRHGGEFPHRVGIAGVDGLLICDGGLAAVLERRVGAVELAEVEGGTLHVTGGDCLLEEVPARAGSAATPLARRSIAASSRMAAELPAPIAFFIALTALPLSLRGVSAR